MLVFQKVNVIVKKGLFSKCKVQLLKDVSFQIDKGSALGIVGKSGSGKTTIANVILRLIPCENGDVLLDGKSVFTKYTRLQLAKKVQLITQNPETSFDPEKTIHHSLEEVAIIHKLIDKENRLSEVLSPLLKDVGLLSADLRKFPKHFSGGELQRFSLIRALMIFPEVIIFDEVDSMLDTTIRINLFETLNKLRHKYNLTYIYITHDIRVLPHIVENVLILSDGKIIEQGTVDILKLSQEKFIKDLRHAITIS